MYSGLKVFNNNFWTIVDASIWVFCPYLLGMTNDFYLWANNRAFYDRTNTFVIKLLECHKDKYFVNETGKILNKTWISSSICLVCFELTFPCLFLVMTWHNDMGKIIRCKKRVPKKNYSSLFKVYYWFRILSHSPLLVQVIIIN